MTKNDRSAVIKPAMQVAGTILCVEDEQDLREMLAEDLEDVGYEVIQAGNGKEAWAYLEHASPDLILCDIAMPDIDGYALLQRIRESRPDLSEVPFVFLSAQDGSGQIIHGKHAGADDYLVKPVNFDLMQATIAARLRQVRRIQNTPAHPQHVESVLRPQSEAMEYEAFQSLSRVLNMLHIGVVLLNADGECLFANVVAQRMEAEGGSADLTRLLTRPAHSRLLQLYPPIRLAIEASRRGHAHTDFLLLTRKDKQHDLLVTVCGLADADVGPDVPVVALFIAGRERAAIAPLQCLETWFDLTPTEARVAWAFARGMRPDEIAMTFAVSLTTVAFHKRNIFHKTQTNREVDLIALLLTLPLVTGERS